MGFEVEFQVITYNSLIPALKTCNIDIVAAGMTITEQREQTVDFSNFYYSIKQIIIVQVDSEMNISVLYGDHERSLQTETTDDLWITENLKDKVILNGDIQRYNTFVLCVSELVNSNVDVVVLDKVVAQRYTAMKPVKIIGVIFTG